LSSEQTESLNQKGNLADAAREAPTFTALWSRKPLRNNLIGVILISSAANFSSYLIGYYTKYFPGNFFFNYAIIAFADCVTMIYLAVISYYVRRVRDVVRINLLLICACSGIYICFVSRYPILVPFGIFVLRVALGGITNYVYHMNQALFPTEFRSLASGSMNCVSRFFAASALIVVEYTT
jgi:Na+/melibiose symporter-like transporter